MPMTHENRIALEKFCKQHNISYKKGWENFARNIKLPNAFVVDVAKEDQLAALQDFLMRLNKQHDAENKIHFRVAAGGKNKTKLEKKYSQSYSLSNVHADDDVVIRLSAFQEITVIDHKKKIVRVGAGVQIGQLDEVLYKNHNMVMPTSSLVPHPSVVGLIGGHGTGRDQPAFAGLIEAITFLGLDNKRYRIDKSHKDFEIIRSQPGLFGIVLNVEVQCAPAKKMKCVVRVRNLNETEKEINDGLYEKYQYVSLAYFPTYQGDNEKISKTPNVMIMTWEPVPLGVENTQNDDLLRWCTQELMLELNDSFQISDILAKHPKLIPLFMRYFVANTQIGNTDYTVINDWPDIVHYQRSFPVTGLKDASLVFNTEGGKRIIAALRHTVKTLDKFAKQDKYPLNFAVYLRHISGTNGGISPFFHEENEHVAALDLTASPGMPGVDEFLDEMQKYGFEKLNARPHWGKRVPLDVDYNKIYGENMTKMLAALQRWYKKQGYTLDDSPYLNTYWRTVLQLPVGKTLVDLEELSHVEGLEPAAQTPIHKAAKYILKALKQYDPALSQNGFDLKQELKRLRYTEKQSYVAHSIFRLAEAVGEIGSSEEAESRSSNDSRINMK